LKQLTIKKYTKKENKEEDVFSNFFDCVLKGNTTKSWPISELNNLKLEVNEKIKIVQSNIVQNQEKLKNLEKF
jgi:hypothetical protein